MTKTVGVLVPPLEKLLTYDVPDRLSKTVSIGSAVTVPLGKRKCDGFVVSTDLEAKTGDISYDLKPIDKLSTSYPHFSAEQLELFRWVADYYGEPLSSVLDVAIPPAVPEKFESYVILVKECADGEKLGKTQKAILGTLKQSSAPFEKQALLRKHRGAASSLKKLEASGHIRIEGRELKDSHIQSELAADWAKREVSLSSAQKEALDSILKPAMDRKFQPFLLHGVTGSGKTEVYIDAVREVRKKGMGALIVVPEIALTPQLIDRFRARLGSDIAVLHSGLNRRIRWDSWRALLEKRSFVAIGARSAIFAPVPNLGLIIIDEEHDSSYKQSDGLRYHARDLAMVRGQRSGCPVILGSATPSLETFHNAMTKKYHYLKLPSAHRSASASLFEMVDLNKIRPKEMRTKNISPTLADALSETLAKKEQAFILYNRRGFAAYYQCDRCETTLRCPHCSVTLTYHRDTNTLLCHYCSYSLFPPKFCATCERDRQDKSSRGEKEAEDAPKGEFVLRGAGTEKVFEEIQELIPTARIDRLDRDVVTDEEHYRQILDNVRNGKTDILVGTQMIAKGHDLPGVTLVGIVDCDVGLHLPDFRSSERAFQLLTQAAGRAGRADKSGRVILQTRVPAHPSIQFTLTQNYVGFAGLELRLRKDLGYPPYGKLLRIVVASDEQSYPMRILSSYKEHAEALIKKEKLQVVVLGPAMAPLERLKAKWRAHLMLKGPAVKSIHRVMSYLQGLKVKTQKARISFDMDPQDML